MIAKIKIEHQSNGYVVTLLDSNGVYQGESSVISDLENLYETLFQNEGIAFTEEDKEKNALLAIGQEHVSTDFIIVPIDEGSEEVDHFSAVLIRVTRHATVYDWALVTEDGIPVTGGTCPHAKLLAETIGMAGIGCPDDLEDEVGRLRVGDMYVGQEKPDILH